MYERGIELGIIKISSLPCYMLTTSKLLFLFSHSFIKLMVRESDS